MIDISLAQVIASKKLKKLKTTDLKLQSINFFITFAVAFENDGKIASVAQLVRAPDC